MSAGSPEMITFLPSTKSLKCPSISIYWYPYMMFSKNQGYSCFERGQNAKQTLFRSIKFSSIAHMNATATPVVSNPPDQSKYICPECCFNRKKALCIMSSSKVLFIAGSLTGIGNKTFCWIVFLEMAYGFLVTESNLRVLDLSVMGASSSKLRAISLSS